MQPNLEKSTNAICGALAPVAGGLARGAITIAIVASILVGAAATSFAAADAEGTNANPAPRISLGECKLESTLPFEDSRRIECSAGQVIVAVYEDAVRCCTLQVN